MFCADAEKVGRWVTDGIGAEYVEGMPAIGIEKDGEVKIGAYYESYTGEGGSIMLFGRCTDPHYATRAFWHHVFAYPFEQLGVKAIYALVNEHNTRARRLDEHLGFTAEHTLRDYFPDGDAILYGMKKEDCRWIRKKP